MFSKQRTSFAHKEEPDLERPGSVYAELTNQESTNTDSHPNTPMNEIDPMPESTNDLAYKSLSEVSDYVRRLRSEAGDTQQHLADELDKSRSSITKAENLQEHSYYREVAFDIIEHYTSNRPSGPYWKVK
jgi:DNA-binding XRE family transcriptional regulator